MGLNDERLIWIEQEDLGKEKTILLQNKPYIVKIPKNINKSIVLRLRGLGKTKENNMPGDLFLHIWLNKGEDIEKNLWLSESSARNGADKKLSLGDTEIIVAIPQKSYHGLTIRLKGLGKKISFDWGAPFLNRKRGNLLVKLWVYPDTITPTYGSFEALSTEDMALEGWVYRKMDEVIKKLGAAAFPADPFQADMVTDAFNEWGWIGIFHELCGYLGLTRINIEVASSGPDSLPGSCQKTVRFKNYTPVASYYKIAINEQFLDNPFSVAAIMAHELCHVIYSECIDDTPTPYPYQSNTNSIAPQTRKNSPLDEEHAVDLLVFMFKLGEFQLRVARDTRLTLGYFNQAVFERIQVIVSKKLKGKR